MSDAIQWLALFAAMAALAALPTTSVLLVVERSIRNGWRQGVWVAIGIMLADVVFVGLAVLGMTALVTALGPFSIVLRWACGVYLVWVGYTLWRNRGGVRVTEGRPGRGKGPGGAISALLSGLFFTLSDLKAIVFYASFLPLFIDLKHLDAMEVALLLAVTIVAVGGVKLGYAVSAERLYGRLRNRRWHTPLRAAMGGGLILTGGYLCLKP